MFSFNFDNSTDISIDDNVTKFPEASRSSLEAIVIREEQSWEEGHLKLNEVVSIDWLESNPFFLSVTRKDDSYKTMISPRNLRMLATPKDLALQTCFLSMSSKHLFQLDTIFSSKEEMANVNPALSSIQKSTPSALMIEPGLDSLCWPISARDFKKFISKKQAMVVHNSISRLEFLTADFKQFQLDSLLQDATKIIVWMKDKKTGMMQYLDATNNAEIALNCYNAGHSLYFNPSLSIQERYLEALSLDLGLGYSLPLDSESTFPGDIEVFAVSGKHVTPWHFDNQDNFTLQIKGTKRWSIKPGGLEEPLTNLHPKSSNASSLQSDRRLHSFCSSSSIEQSTNEAIFHGGQYIPLSSDVSTVVLRPGSFLYIPSGYWHQVEAEEEEGSISINFSMSSGRYSDVILRSISYLVMRDADLRSSFSSIESISELKNLLKQKFDRLASLVSKIDPEKLFPPYIAQDADSPRGHDHLFISDSCSTEQNHSSTMLLWNLEQKVGTPTRLMAMKLVPNIFCTLVLHKGEQLDKLVFLSALFMNLSNLSNVENEKENVIVYVDSALRDIVTRLISMHLALNDAPSNIPLIQVESLIQSVHSSKNHLALRLIATCIYTGYFTLHE
jgi:Cupin-like domain